MFDIFYSGPKPNLFTHEQPAQDIAHARQLSRTRFFWWVNYLTDYSGFDFLFEPTPWQAEYCHAWPSQWQKDSGTYLVPVQGNNSMYYNTDRTLTRLPTQDNWEVPANFDADTFDFSWHPDYSEPDYLYQFGTQHQRTGGPQYIKNKNKDNAGIKFVDQIQGSVRSDTTPIIEIDHLDNNAGQIPNTVRTVRYFDNYLDTLTRIANTTASEYVWICSSVCDYRNFDFSWHPDQWQATMLHVFASDNMKFGDTFYMHVPSFRARIGQFELLDWYDINFVGVSVPRRPVPAIAHTYDTQVEAIKNTTWTGPVAIFTTQEDTTKDNDIIKDIPPVNLWREQTKNIIPLSSGASTVIIPRTAIPYIRKQLYDYPNIDRTQRHMLKDSPLDIVFIDNGESNAEENWAFLNVTTTNNNNRIHRSSGVNGRVAAYHAAAQLSTTPWFFAVFAKLKVDGKFDWLWQPDRMQEPKHYIFHAHNPVTGLVYGHMSMIAYNRQLVLDNLGIGLDFTLDSAHEVVPILSGTANYTDTPWSAWRTAFREVLKLRGNADVESQYRLNKWLAPTTGHPDSEYSTWGAEDAVEYYDAVAGDITELRKSYDWSWLASYVLIKRNITVT